MTNEDKNLEKSLNNRLATEGPVGSVDIAERTHLEAKEDLKKDNEPVDIHIMMYRGDRGWLIRLAKAEGISLAMLCRRIMRNFLLSRPYLSPAELQALRNCYRELCEVATALGDSVEIINKLVEAGVVNECFLEIKENNLSLSEKVERLIGQVKAVIDQAETRALLDRKWR